MIVFQRCVAFWININTAKHVGLKNVEKFFDQGLQIKLKHLTFA